MVRRVTIADVARCAGVAPSTVSHALSGHRPISVPVKEKIQDCIQRLGYRPSTVARSLREGRTRSIGLFLPPPPALVHDLFVSELLAALTAALDEKGYSPLLFCENPKIQESLSFLEERLLPIDGAVLTNPRSDGVFIRYFQKMGIPFVVLGPPDTVTAALDVSGPAPAHSSIDCPLERAVQEACTCLTRQGSHSPVLVNSAAQYRKSTATAASFRLQFPGGFELPVDTDDFDSRFSALLSREKPDGLVCAQSSLLPRLTSLCRETGRLPPSFPVVGIADSQEARLGSPPLSVVDLQPAVLGRLAAQTLLAVLQGEACAHRDVPPLLVCR
jgi:DNA-binding LacI/PurR family transcriptional regulator